MASTAEIDVVQVCETMAWIGVSEGEFMVARYTVNISLEVQVRDTMNTYLQLEYGYNLSSVLRPIQLIVVLFVVLLVRLASIFLVYDSVIVVVLILVLSIGVVVPGHCDSRDLIFSNQMSIRAIDVLVGAHLEPSLPRRSFMLTHSIFDAKSIVAGRRRTFTGLL
jgi:hypothetical protein